jgi:sugar lactone lactonase YvrE
MTVDCAGNLYAVRINQKDIIVVSPSNSKVGQIVIPNSGQLTNVAFGGTNHQTLYVTAQGTGTQRGVFKLAMPLPGMPY